MGSAYLEGPLSKWTNVMKGWQYRWFVLDDNAGLLSYYTSRDKMIRGSRRGCVRLSNAIIGIDDEDDSTFTITVDLKMFHFQARDYEERKQWASALEDTILRHSQRQLEPMLSEPTFVDFDNQLSEADAYLQLLIKNVKELEQKVKGLENVTEKQNMESILLSALEMVEAVKKSIVLLQLAKNAISSNQNNHHIVQSAMPHTSNNAAPVDSVLISTVASHSEGSQVEVDVNSITPEPSVDSNSATHEPSVDSISDNSTDQPVERVDPLPASNLSVIPPTSYSSSDEEDDEFYDADEDMRSLSSRKSRLSLDKSTKPPPKSPDRYKKTEASQSNGDNNTASEVTKIEKLEKLVPELTTPTKENCGDLYMEEEGNSAKEGESVEEHKSVIMHLLSQVKLGMDLTKVVLPTFILERRSLLEMYADFFAHADLFLNIVDQKTPELRMIETVRFYLSTFAAGRNSSVAKKPYNPILGESFQCFWNLSNTSNTNEIQSIKSETVSDGPLPWAKADELAFVAEQVSHHPPISAFYSEHKEKRIQFNGHIWTKSKFLGLSIGVHNIGQGCVTLLDYDEEYIVNFPNGYGRSILTIPWVELGGDCTITCEKTGYNAFVKFHTKPFYGGKPHRILAEIFAPNGKKPICTVDGEWNDVMWAHYSNGKDEKFIDTKNKAKIPKKVRNLKNQEPTESRKLWEKVTVNLKANNIDQATEGKRTLEDKQRKDAKYRLENDIIYKPKLFYEDDCQNWIYHSPLTGRVNNS